MIKVSVLYPHISEEKFDIDYYINVHMPMVREKLGAALKGMAVEHGISGPSSKLAPTYVCMGHMLFDSIDAYKAAFMPLAAEIMADSPNYTKVKPVVQISEIRMS